MHDDELAAADISSPPTSSPPRRPASRRRALLIGIACLSSLVIALLLDTTVSAFARAHSISKHSTLMKVMKQPGDYPFTLAVIAIIVVFFQKRGLRAAGHIALAGLCGGAIYCIVKWTVGRRRPVTGIPAFDFDHFSGGLSGFTHAENLSFPSGHVTFAFSTAAVLAIHFPRVRGLCYAGAALVAFERVWENAHYLADVVAGAMLGVFSAYLVVWIVEAIERRSAHRSTGFVRVIENDAADSRRVMEEAV